VLRSHRRIVSYLTECALGGNVTALQSSFAALLRDCRRAVSLTQEDLAAQSGLSVRTISDLERGRTSRPYRRSVQLIADALNLSGGAREEFLRVAGCAPAGRQLDRLRLNGSGDEAAVQARWAGAAEQSTRPVVPRQLPGSQRHFTGRAAELERLAALLDQHDGGHRAMTVVAISGTAGVGKTALAVHWAHQIADRFPDGQFYINLRGFDPSASPMPAGAALRAFLDALQVPPAQIPASLDAQVGLYRSLLADRRCLVVLDNAADAGHVRALLPGGAACLVIVTSRSELTSLIAAGEAQLITLDVFSHDDAHEMVTHRLGADRPLTEPEAVREMISLCAWLPLAGGIAVARAAARPDFPLSALVDELKDAGHRLDALELDEAAASVRAVISWSYQNLSEPAARMFRLLSEHPGPDISAAAAASLAAIPRSQARAALRELARSHLVSEQTPGRFAFHDLLRAFAGEQARAQDDEGERTAAARRLLDHYLHTCCGTARMLDPTRDPITMAAPQPGVLAEELRNYQESWAWLEAEYRVLLAVTEVAAAKRLAEHAWQLPWVMQTFFFRRGYWQDFAAIQRTAVAVAERHGDLYAQAHAHHGLGRASALIGCYAAATDHMSRAVQLYRELGQPTAEARCHIDVGHAFSRQGRYQDALEQARQAEQLYLAAGHQAGQAGALNNIGWYQIQLGQYATALAHCQRALTLFEAAGSRHGAGVALASLGFAHYRLGDLARGIASCGQALDCMREHGDLPGQADVLTQLGEIYLVDGDRGAAIDCWQRALDIFIDLNHPGAAELRGRLVGHGVPA
jgi:tetratricopeptide (TPR) repeat protein/transcriptional regulator with XRE-family HTH domain